MAGNVLPLIGSIADRAINHAETSYFMDKRFAQQKELIDDERRYMSPAAQLSRMRAAGLNPDLAYSQLGSAGSPSLSESDIVSGSQISGAAGQMERLRLQEEMQESQIALNDSLARKADAEAGTAVSHSAWYDRMVKAQDVLDALRESSKEYNVQKTAESLAMIDQITANIGKIQAESDWIRSKKFYQDLENAHFDEKFAAEMGLKKAQTNAANASASESRAHAELYKKQVAQVEEVTKQLAERWKYDLEILSNKAAISDKERDLRIAQMYRDAYEACKYKGFVKYDPLAQEWVLTKEGAALGIAEGATDFVGKILGALGNFYTHHSFKNYTPQPEPTPPPVKPTIKNVWDMGAESEVKGFKHYEYYE